MMIDTTHARWTKDPDSVSQTVAFVFQGGGSLSAPQIGMLRALVEEGIQPDLVIGTSAGALNAVGFASDPTTAGLDRLEHLWLRLRRQDVAGLSARNLLAALAGRRNGLLDAAPLGRLLATGVVANELQRTRVAAHVVATELMSGEPIIMSAGDTVSALLASAAFPGLYPPVVRDGIAMIDGGVVADVPLLQAEALGATVSFVLPAAMAPQDSATPPQGSLAMAYHALEKILESSARRDTLAARGTVHALPAAVTRATNPLDFRETRRLITDGYRLASRWLRETPVPAPVTSMPVRDERELVRVDLAAGSRRGSHRGTCRGSDGAGKLAARQQSRGCWPALASR